MEGELVELCLLHVSRSEQRVSLSQIMLELLMLQTVDQKTHAINQIRFSMCFVLNVQLRIVANDPSESLTHHPRTTRLTPAVPPLHRQTDSQRANSLRCDNDSLPTEAGGQCMIGRYLILQTIPINPHSQLPTSPPPYTRPSSP